MVIGILAFVESLFTLSFPKVAVKILKKMKMFKNWQNVKSVKKVAWWEFVLAIIIFVIGINL
jgi:hypothetical protein